MRMSKAKSKKRWAIRRHKNPIEFEYLQLHGRWGERINRREFTDMEEAYKEQKKYKSMGIHARVVPYGSNDDGE